MRRFPARLPAIACLVGLSAMTAVTLSGCVGSDGGYGYGGDLGADYYEPYGFGYGGWGRDYHVAPYHDHGFAAAGFHGGHAFRPAPAGHPMPSLPAGRGGGFGHAGGGFNGGHAGGGGGRR